VTDLGKRSMLGFLPKRRPAHVPVAARGILSLRESVDELPIRAPRDDWETVHVDGVAHIQRSFELKPGQIKMLVCDIIDAQDACGHEVSVTIEGPVVTVRSTTHEFGEPTERDREIARHIDTSYNELRSIYR
jgi:pterin-4a-carbinolamine dehydratase